MKSIKVFAAANVPNVFGRFYNKGDLIKETNPDKVERIVNDGACGYVTLYYSNGLHEVYNQNSVRVEIEV